MFTIAVLKPATDFSRGIIPRGMTFLTPGCMGSDKISPKIAKPVVAIALSVLAIATNIPPTQAQRRLAPDAYRLGAGDRIRIDNGDLPQQSGEYVVPTDGVLNLPLIGSVSILGLTLEQADRAITARYNRILKEPDISIRLLEPRPINIAISGEINNPGSYTIPVIGREPGIRYPTVTQVIQQAGGITQSADISRIQIRRRQGRSATINIRAFLQNGNPNQDITLRDGDTIFIPTATRVTPTQARQLATTSISTDVNKPRTVSILGEVTRPGSYVVLGGNTQIDRTTAGLPTITRALQIAGGITPAADIRNIQIRRPTKTGREQVFRVNLWQFLQAGDASQDLILQDGDTIFIPTTTINPAEARQLNNVNFTRDITKPRNVAVLGEVTRPGSYVILGGNTQIDRTTAGLPTVTRALQVAGGITAAADIRNIQIRRPNNAGGQQVFRVNLWQFLQAGDSNQDFLLEDGDTIFIPTLTTFNPAEARRLDNVSFSRDITKPRSVSVLGEITRPGSYVVIGGDTQIDRTTAGLPTLTRALQLAGGVTPLSDIRNIQLRRPNQFGGEQVFNINLWQFLQTGDASQDLLLEDGDTIFIPTLTTFNPTEARLLSTASFAADLTKPRTVAVVGEVKRPGPYVVLGGDTQIDRTTGGFPTVVRAIQLAGGITPGADVRNIQIRRPSRAGVEQIIKVNFWQLLQAGDFSQDAILQEGDTVFVPTATEINPAEVSQLAASSLSPARITVRVVGEVGKPGTIEVAPNTTLSQALLAAGGINRDRGKKSEVELIRLNSNGTITLQTIAVDFAQGIDSKTNPLVRDNDIIVVNRSNLARIADALTIGVGGGGLSPIFRILEILRNIRLF